jgi:hypothetical protein
MFRDSIKCCLKNISATHLVLLLNRVDPVAAWYSRCSKLIERDA